ncbi:helix-turn-helix domain-containing protein [Actinomadura kijaniata]|uniref:helix-turn-helix domain-containing protein n=1 Tax=Actinomadura kijaniata TaxID=46161 RepID=UPI003F1B2A63
MRASPREWVALTLARLSSRVRGGASAGPDPSRARTGAAFVEAMREYRIWKGEPSYQAMAKAAGCAASTLWKLEKKDRLPKLDKVLAYLRGCGATPEELEVWRRAWWRIARCEARRPGSPSPPGTG